MYAPRPPSSGRQILNVAGRTLADRWRSLLAWTVGVVAIAVVQLSVYPSVAETSEGMQQFVEQWPEPLREVFGLADYTSGPGYLNAEMFSFVVPLVLIAVAVGVAAGATAGEEEQGTADLLMSLPVRRWAVLTGKIAAMVVSVLIVSLALGLTLVIGAPVVDLEVSTSGVAAATTMSLLLGLAFGGVAFLLAALTGRRAAALGVAIGLAIAAFLLHALAPLADWLEPWQDASPFKWAYGEQPISTGLDLGGAALLIATAVVTLSAAVFAFGRRDVRTI